MLHLVLITNLAELSIFRLVRIVIEGAITALSVRSDQLLLVRKTLKGTRLNYYYVTARINWLIQWLGLGFTIGDKD